MLARPEDFSLEALQEIGEGPALICNWQIIMLSSKTYQLTLEEVEYKCIITEKEVASLIKKLDQHMVIIEESKIKVLKNVANLLSVQLQGIELE